MYNIMNSSNLNDNYDTCILEYKIHAEYQQLIKNRVPDVYVIPSASSSFIWYGIIFLHQGIYEGGIFRFTLFIPDNFDCPRVIFNPIVYHPMINSESGELDVKQRIFYQIETKNSLNKKAAELYETNFDLFMKNVKSCIDECNRRIYENPPINSDDPHAIRFTKLPQELFTQIKQNMVTMVNSSGQDNELSLLTNDKCAQ